MFTGLSRTSAASSRSTRGDDGARLRIATALGAEIGLGDSVAVDGVCLTATAADADGFETEAMNQTLELTALGDLERRRPGQPRARDAGRRPARRPHRPGPRRRRRRGRSRSRRTASPAALRVGLGPELLPLRGRPGLDRA